MAAKEAKVVTCFSQKGGSGKTTTSMELAGAMGDRGLVVHVIDMDPQGTATTRGMGPRSKAFKGTVTSLAKHGENFTAHLAPYVENNDLIIIDCPPAMDSRVPWKAMLISDLAIIPTFPFAADFFSNLQSQELAIEAERKNRGLKTVGFFVNVDRTRFSREGMELLKKKSHVPLLESFLSRRILYPEAQMLGCPVSAFGDPKATAEVDAFADEVLGILGMTAPESPTGPKDNGPKTQKTTVKKGRGTR